MKQEDDLQCDPKACLFLRGVGIFDLILLSHFLTKMRSFCVHQKGNFLNFSKLTLLLSIDHFWYHLWPVKHKRAFFLRHPVYLLNNIGFTYMPVQNSIQQRQKFSDEIFIILASIILIHIRIIEFEIKTKGNFEKMHFSHFKY